MRSQLGNNEKIIGLFNNNHQPLDVNMHAKVGFHSWEMLCQVISCCSSCSLLWAQPFQDLSFVPRDKSIWAFEGKSSPCQVRRCFWCEVLQKKRCCFQKYIWKWTSEKQIGPSLFSLAIACSPKRNPSWQYLAKTWQKPDSWSHSLGLCLLARLKTRFYVKSWHVLWEECVGF